MNRQKYARIHRNDKTWIQKNSNQYLKQAKLKMSSLFPGYIYCPSLYYLRRPQREQTILDNWNLVSIRYWCWRGANSFIILLQVIDKNVWIFYFLGGKTWCFWNPEEKLYDPIRHACRKLRNEWTNYPEHDHIKLSESFQENCLLYKNDRKAINK